MMSTYDIGCGCPTWAVFNVVLDVWFKWGTVVGIEKLETSMSGHITPIRLTRFVEEELFTIYDRQFSLDR